MNLILELEKMLWALNKIYHFLTFRKPNAEFFFRRRDVAWRARLWSGFQRSSRIKQEKTKKQQVFRWRAVPHRKIYFCRWSTISFFHKAQKFTTLSAFHESFYFKSFVAVFTSFSAVLEFREMRRQIFRLKMVLMFSLWSSFLLQWCSAVTFVPTNQMEWDDFVIKQGKVILMHCIVNDEASIKSKKIRR